MITSIIAVVTGIVILGITAAAGDAIVHALMPSRFNAVGGSNDPVALVASLAVTAIAAAIAAVIVVRIAPEAARRNVVVFAALQLLATVATSIALADHAPVWYHVLAPIVEVIAIVAAGFAVTRTFTHSALPRVSDRDRG